MSCFSKKKNTAQRSCLAAVLSPLMTAFIQMILSDSTPLFISSSTLYFALSLSTFENSRSQFLLDRLGRCLKLIVSSRGTSCHEFASRFGLELFYTRKNPNQTHPHVVYFKSCMDPLCGQINNSIGNCRTDPAGWRRAKASAY